MCAGKCVCCCVSVATVSSVNCIYNMFVKAVCVCLGEVRVSSEDGALDLALVDASLDLEESVESPVGSPRVGDEPVVGSVLVAPADDLDGVA